MFYLLFRREPRIPKTEFRGHILVKIKTNKNTREIGHKVDSKKQTMANYSNAGKNPSMNLDFSIPNFRQILWGERIKPEKFFFNQFQSTVGRTHTQKCFYWGEEPHPCIMKGLPIKMYTARPANGRNNQVAQKCQRFLYTYLFFFLLLWLFLSRI